MCIRDRFWLPTLRLYKHVDPTPDDPATPIDESLPRVELVEDGTYELDDLGSNGYDGFLHYVAAAGSTGTYYVTVSDLFADFGWDVFNGGVDDYRLHVSIEHHAVDGFVFAPQPLIDAEEAIQQLEQQHFFTFGDPNVGNTEQPDPTPSEPDRTGSVSSTTPYAKVSGFGDGSIDVYEFTITDAMLNPGSLTVTSDPLGAATGPFYSMVTLEFGGTPRIGDVWTLGVRHRNYSVTINTAAEATLSLSLIHI